MYPQWNQTRTNRELLTDIRRGFHTLKGSGRMAGAFALGDFAWAHEDMLNQVLNGQLPADDRMSRQLKAAIDEVNSRQTFYYEAQQKDARVEQLIAQANAIIKREETLAKPAPIPPPAPLELETNFDLASEANDFSLVTETNSTALQEPDDEELLDFSSLDEPTDKIANTAERPATTTVSKHPESATTPARSAQGTPARFVLPDEMPLPTIPAANETKGREVAANPPLRNPGTPARFILPDERQAPATKNDPSPWATKTATESTSAAPTRPATTNTPAERSTFGDSAKTEASPWANLVATATNKQESAPSATASSKPANDKSKPAVPTTPTPPAETPAKPATAAVAVTTVSLPNQPTEAVRPTLPDLEFDLAFEEQTIVVEPANSAVADNQSDLDFTPDPTLVSKPVTSSIVDLDNLNSVTPATGMDIPTLDFDLPADNGPPRSLPDFDSLAATAQVSDIPAFTPAALPDFDDLALPVTAETPSPAPSLWDFALEPATEVTPAISAPLDFATLNPPTAPTASKAAAAINEFALPDTLEFSSPIAPSKPSQPVTTTTEALPELDFITDDTSDEDGLPLFDLSAEDLQQPEPNPVGQIPQAPAAKPSFSSTSPFLEDEEETTSPVPALAAANAEPDFAASLDKVELELPELEPLDLNTPVGADDWLLADQTPAIAQATTPAPASMPATQSPAADDMVDWMDFEVPAAQTRAPVIEPTPTSQQPAITEAPVSTLPLELEDHQDQQASLNSIDFDDLDWATPLAKDNKATEVPHSPAKPDLIDLELTVLDTSVQPDIATALPNTATNTADPQDFLDFFSPLENETEPTTATIQPEVLVTAPAIAGPADNDDLLDFFSKEEVAPAESQNEEWLDFAEEKPQATTRLATTPITAAVEAKSEPAPSRTSTVDSHEHTAASTQAKAPVDAVKAVEAPVEATPPALKPAASLPSESDSEARLIWQLFWEEFPDQIQSLDQHLQQLRYDPGNNDIIHELEREFHTIKGGARMAQLSDMADISHNAESLLNQMHYVTTVAEPELNTLQQAVDQLHELAEAYSRLTAPPPPETKTPNNNAPEPPPSVTTAPATPPVTTVVPEALNLKQTVNQTWARPRSSKDEFGSMLERLLVEQAESLPDIRVLDTAARTKQTIPVEEQTNSTQPAANQESIRLSAAFIDNLINRAVGLNMQQIRMSEHLSCMGMDVDELIRTVARLRQQVRALELESEAQIHSGRSAVAATNRHANNNKDKDAFDPLEMDQYAEIQRISRSLAESLNDLVNLEADLAAQLRKGEQLLQADMQTTRQLQQDLLDTRLVALTMLVPRLRRLTRQTATELEKQVTLEIEGEECELDRNLLQHMTAPLEHLIRNSISHGIELPDERERVGKARTGKIVLSVSRDEAEIVIRFRDDGCGLDRQRLLKKAREQGLVGAHEILSDSEIERLILRPGFSTAQSVSQIAGRGIGMDVVYSELKALGGSLQIHSERGKGIEFTMRLPFTLVVNPVLLTEVQGQTYALPISGIQGLSRINGKDLNEAVQQPNAYIDFANQKYPLYHMADLIGQNPVANEFPADEHFPVIFINLQGQSVAWIIDNLRGRREVVLQPLGIMFRNCRLYSAATVSPDGRVFLVPDMAELARQAIQQNKVAAIADHVPETKAPEVAGPARIMVVDDSITVRRVTEKFLASQDYIVGTAKDGMEALEKVGDFMPDVVLLDIEMPRMDGFELLGHLRRDPRWVNLPVIMISSRTANKHREHAASIGATGFLGKPYQNDVLLSAISEVLETAC